MIHLNKVNDQDPIPTKHRSDKTDERRVYYANESINGTDQEYFKLRIVHGSAVSAAIAARQAPTTQYQAANSMPTGRHHCGSQQALPRFARSVRF